MRAWRICTAVGLCRNAETNERTQRNAIIGRTPEGHHGLGLGAKLHFSKLRLHLSRVGGTGNTALHVINVGSGEASDSGIVWPKKAVTKRIRQS